MGTLDLSGVIAQQDQTPKPDTSYGFTPTFVESSAPQDDPTFKNLIDANFRRESILGSTGERAGFEAARMFVNRDPSYNPAADPYVLALPKEQRLPFYYSQSAEETQIMLERNKLLDGWKNTINAEGLTGRGFVAAVVGNAPDMLALYFVGLAAKAKNAGMISRLPAKMFSIGEFGTGKTVAGKMALAGSSAAIGEGLREAYKFSVEENRTATESLLNITGATFLGAALPLGGTLIRQIGTGLNKAGESLDPLILRAQNNLTSDAIDGVKDMIANPLNRVVSEESSAGNLMSRIPLIKNWSPNFRVDQWTSEAMQKVQRGLLSTALVLNKNLKGTASRSVEDAIKFHHQFLNDAHLAGDAAYQEYAGSFGEQMVNLATQTKLTDKQFNNEISRAIREGSHSNPFVEKAAEKYRTLFEHFAKELKSSGLSDIDVDPKYLSRLYDHQAIRNSPTVWDREIAAAYEQYHGLDPEAALKAAQATRQTITENYGVMYGSGMSMLKQRTLDLPDSVLEKWMINDAREISTHYTRAVAPRIELAKAAPDTKRLVHIIKGINDAEAKLGEGPIPLDEVKATRALYDEQLQSVLDAHTADAGAGSADGYSVALVQAVKEAQGEADIAAKLEKLKFAQAIEERKAARDAVNLRWMKDEVSADYDAKYQKAFGSGDDKLANAIVAEKQDALKEIEASRLLLLGQYGADNDPTGFLSRATRGVLMWNQQRLLGRVLLSQVNDAAGIGVKFGIIRSAKASRAMWQGLKDGNVDIRTLRVQAGAADLVNNARILEMTDTGGRSFNRTFVESGLERTQALAGKLTGFNYWNDHVKLTTAISAADYFHWAAQEVTAGRELGQWDKPFLASLGMGTDELRQLGQMAHAEHYGVMIPDFQRWGDPAEGISRIYGEAMRKAVDTTIVTPMLGQKALWTRTNWGKAVSQFKGFVQGANESIMAHILQKMAIGGNADRVGALIGTSTMLAAGAASYTLKRLSYGKGIPDLDEQFAIESFDNSGMGGMLMELNNTVEKVSDQHAGIRPWMGNKAGAWRYQSRKADAAILGPAFGAYFDAKDIYRGVMKEGPMSGATENAMIRFLPLNNALFLNLAYDGLDLVTGGDVLPGKPGKRFGDRPKGP